MTRRAMWAIGVLSAAFAFASAARADALRFYGYAYDLDRGQYLYTEVFDVRTDHGRWVEGTTRYVAPDGTELAKRSFDFSSDPYVPVFQTRQSAAGEVEGIASVGPTKIEAFRQTRDGGRKAVTIERNGLMASDCGFHPLLIDRLETLSAGQTVTFRIVVPGKLDAFGFRARKTAETEVDGHRAIQLVGEPDSLLRLMVPALTLIYDVPARRLVEYRGPSNILDPATGKAFRVRIVYPTTPPAGAPSNLPAFDAP